MNVPNDAHNAEYERGYKDGLNAGRYGCRWENGGPSRLHLDASPSHAEGAWCLRCNCFEPLNAFGGGYVGGYLIDSGERQPPLLIDGCSDCGQPLDAEGNCVNPTCDASIVFPQHNDGNESDG